MLDHMTTRDAERRRGRITTDAKPKRVTVDTAAFDAAFADKGCTTGQSRADLIGATRRNVDRYRFGEVAPTLPTARRIASRLGRDIDELWPADSEIAA